MRRHLAVLDPGVRVPELDCFNRLSLRGRQPLTYHQPAMFGLDSLRRVEEGVSGVIILGSGASVNAADPWQQELRAWLQPKISSGLPMLGLCYGHQLLAHLLGGEVGWQREDHAKTQGFREIELRANTLWGTARKGVVLVSHAETVTALPATCDAVGQSASVAIEAFAHRQRPIWGFQAHPEATAAFAVNNGVPLRRVDATEDLPADPWSFGHKLVDAFLSFVADRADWD